MRNSYGDLSFKDAAYIATRMIKNGTQVMHLGRFGQICELPDNQGDSVTFVRYMPLPLATAPLAEGITPAGSKITQVDVKAVVESYGDIVPVTRKLTKRHRKLRLTHITKLLTTQATETIETIRFNALKAGSNVFYANGVTSRGAVTSVITAADLKKIERGLSRNRGKKIQEIVVASEKVGTKPIQAAYIALGHTDLKADIEACKGFTPVHEYGSVMKALPGEVGSIGAFRFILSDLYVPFEEVGASGTDLLSGGVEVGSAANADVYPILILAADAYGITPFRGKKAVTPVVFEPKPTKDDPMGQKGSASWITDQTAIILVQEWLVRYEVGVNADPVVN